MLHLYKLVDPSKDLLLTDFLEEVEEFVDQICYRGSQEGWPSGYTLNDIIRYSGHNRWISFKRSLESNHNKLIEQIVNTDSGNLRLNNLIKLILSSYQKIEYFIVSHLPSEDFYSRWSNGEELEGGPWNRLDIAFELQSVILKIFSKVKEIDSSLIPNSMHIVKNERKDNNSSKLKDSRLSVIFQKLLEKGFVDLSGEGPQYLWKAEKGLYGYFVDIVTECLEMRSDSNKIPWYKFKDIIVNHDKILRSARDRVSKYNAELLPKPNGYRVILEIVSKS